MIAWDDGGPDDLPVRTPERLACEPRCPAELSLLRRVLELLRKT